MRHKHTVEHRPFIFYDVDGVLNTYTTPEEDKHNGMAQVLSLPHVERLQSIQKAVDGYLICVSSWRKFDANVAALEAVGLWQGLHTEYDNPALPTRAHEVRDWLEWQNRGPDTPFVILDDSPQYYTGADYGFLDHMPAIDSAVGLVGSHVAWVLTFLREASL